MSRIGKWYWMFWYSPNLVLEINIGHVVKGNYGAFFSMCYSFWIFNLIVSSPSFSWMVKSSKKKTKAERSEG